MKVTRADCKKFCVRKRRVSAGILPVFQGDATHGWRKIFARRRGIFDLWFLNTCYHPDSTACRQTVLSGHMGHQPITGPAVLPYPDRFRQETPGPVYQGSSTGSHQPPALWGQDHSAFFPSKSLTDAILYENSLFCQGNSPPPLVPSKVRLDFFVFLHYTLQSKLFIK